MTGGLWTYRFRNRRSRARATDVTILQTGVSASSRKITAKEISSVIDMITCQKGSGKNSADIQISTIDRSEINGDS